MIREGDVQWWVLEARQHPESAPAIIQELAKRLAELEAENERLRDEAIRSQAQAPDEIDTAEVASLRENVAALQRVIDTTHAAYALVLVSHRLQTARLAVHQMWQLAREGGCISDDRPLIDLRRLLPARTSDDLLLLSSLGRGRVVPVSEIGLAGGEVVWPESGTGGDQEGEWLAAATNSIDPPRFRTVVTRRGFVRQHIRVSFDRAMEQGHQAFESPLKRDEARAIVDGDAQDVLVVTRWGRVERFSQRSIAAQGSLAIELGEDDEVVAALPLDGDPQILVATASGRVMRRDSSTIVAAKLPGGGGKSLIQAYDVLDAFPFLAGQSLLFVTYAGKLVIEPLRDVPLSLRSAKGHLLHDLSRDPAVAVALLPLPFLQDGPLP